MSLMGALYVLTWVYFLGGYLHFWRVLEVKLWRRCGWLVAISGVLLWPVLRFLTPRLYKHEPGSVLSESNASNS